MEKSSLILAVRLHLPSNKSITQGVLRMTARHPLFFCRILYLWRLDDILIPIFA